MRRDIEILKSLYLPEIEEIYPFAPDLKTSIQQDAFWDYFNTILFDAKEIANFLFSYKVAKAEHFISRFELLKQEYISYLASDYCNGETNPTIEVFLKIQFKPFIEEVTFQREIKQAITITERERLKRKLLLIDKAATFEITDNEIKSAIQLLEKKKEHEKLKEKMKEWDFAEQTSNLSNANIYFQLRDDESATDLKAKQSRKPSKIVSLSFIKYAVAACFVGAMIWIGAIFYNNQPKENNLAANKSDTLKAPATIATQPEFAKVVVSENILPLMEEHGLGYAPVETKIRIIINDLQPRIASMEKYIADNSHGTRGSGKVDSSVQYEIDSLRKITKYYTFDGKSLQLFASPENHLNNTVLKTTDNHYYYRVGNHFFTLQQADKPIRFAKVTDKVIIDRLERVVFDNEN